jgi:Flp pilus assembly pilin Flp
MKSLYGSLSNLLARFATMGEEGATTAECNVLVALVVCTCVIVALLGGDLTALCDGTVAVAPP